MERDEKCRLIGKWLGIIDIQECTCRKFLTGRWPDGHCGHLNFFTDESANALVLEKMRRPLLVSDWPGCEGWRVDIGVEHHNGPPIGPTCQDRKAAIAEAALKLISLGRQS